MSVPQQLSAHSNGDGTKGVYLPEPVNLTAEKTQPHLSAIMRESVLIKLSILMCAYNEESTIIKAVDEVLAADYPCDMELIVVDDGSTDATPTLLRHIQDPRVIVYRHPRNKGKGAALLSAASIASGTHILPFDADLEYCPDDIKQIIRPVLRGRCDVVYGVRMFGLNTVYRSYKYAVGNRLLTQMANILFDACLSDLHTCLKLIPLAMFESLNLRESGFGLDTEVTALLLKAGVRPFEVPVSYFSRSRDEGKKITWRDAIVCMSILLRVRMLRSSSLKAIRSLRESAERVGVLVPQPTCPNWQAVRTADFQDDGQPDVVVTS